MTSTEHVLVTGAGGLIGSWSARALHNNGIRVSAWYKTVPENKLPWHMYTGDLAKDPLQVTIGDDVQFNTIIHCAAYLPSSMADLEKVLDINRKIDEQVVRYAVANHARLIYLSGTSVYGGSGRLFTEEADTDLQGIARKYEIEKVIQDKVDDHLILRVSAPYGPSQKSRTVLRIFIENALAKRPLLYYGSGEREQDFTFAGDIADAIVKCIEHPHAKGIFNITSGKPVNMKTLARLVVDTVPGSTSEIKASGMPDEQENYRARFSIAKAKRHLGWEPQTDLEEGIKKWIKYITDENSSSQ